MADQAAVTVLSPERATQYRPHGTHGWDGPLADTVADQLAAAGSVQERADSVPMPTRWPARQRCTPVDVVNKETQTQAWIRLLGGAPCLWRRLDPPKRVSPHQLFAQLAHHVADGAPYGDRAGLAKLTA
ncbi:hypothetical protein SAMN04489729_1563 [Amycolatopsis lurida]|uniref:Uncharacterized protein n=1 Tax=Amycolatopsis lurida NRRL 2430 TaxID=1460371 RepID=A0A2P2FZ95_AMYLU|nr:hypothetical protein BB31_06840 [Amycolatopsis lurida NRRL 2430]SEC43382.1 hypothetical protein SAMN04489729_1563 [Amycolatopsis lurida]